MNKNYIKFFIEKDDFQLLSKEYINSKTKLSLKCFKDQNHEYSASFNYFKNGVKCKNTLTIKKF
jgi:hypothetical protein